MKLGGYRIKHEMNESCGKTFLVFIPRYGTHTRENLTERDFQIAINNSQPESTSVQLN